MLQEQDGVFISELFKSELVILMPCGNVEDGLIDFFRNSL